MWVDMDGYVWICVDMGAYGYIWVDLGVAATESFASLRHGSPLFARFKIPSASPKENQLSKPGTLQSTGSESTGSVTCCLDDWMTR